MSKPSIIIIGAGAAGLVAAKELSPAFNVIVLEAAADTGGRIRSIFLQGNIFEAGAEFIHGKAPLTVGLLKEAGIKYVQATGEMYRKKNGRFINVQEMTEGWDGLLERMGNLKEDMRIQEFLDQYYAGTVNESLRRHVKSFAEGFDVADITKASVKELWKEWNSEAYESSRIPGGYCALVNYLQKRAEAGGTVVYTNTLIKKVEWAVGSVAVYAGNGKKYTADKLMVTIPVGVLQQPDAPAYIQFIPSLHFNHNVAADIGFGAVIKVIFKFQKAFWQPDAGFILSDELFPTWWTQLPGDSPIITGWLGGPAATAFSGETDEAIRGKALASLAAIYDRPIYELENELDLAKVFNWQKNEYAMGAYSYSTLYSEEARKIINTPQETTIFFAGEALYTGDHPGTVEAALASGIETAVTIKESLW